MEEWRSVVGYEHIYEVSNLGRVRTAEGKKTVSDYHGERIWRQRVLKPKQDEKGYRRVNLWKNLEVKTKLVHRLVAKAFIDNPENYPMINHLDCDPTNNVVTNLEWCNNSMNVRHAMANGRYPNLVAIRIQLKPSGKIMEFVSLRSCSLFIGKNQGYMFDLIRKGIWETDELVILEINLDAQEE